MIVTVDSPLIFLAQHLLTLMLLGAVKSTL